MQGYAISMGVGLIKIKRKLEEEEQVRNL